MSIDDLLLALSIGGIGLSLAYLRAEYLQHRRLKAAERQWTSMVRTLHIAKMPAEQIDMPRELRIAHSPAGTGALQLWKSLTRASRNLPHNSHPN